MMCRRGWPLLLFVALGCSTHPITDVCDYVRPGTMGPNVLAPYGGVGIPQGPLVPPAPVIVPAVVVPGPGVAPVPGVVPPPAPLPGNRFPQLQPPTSEIPLPPTPPSFPR